MKLSHINLSPHNMKSRGFLLDGPEQQCLEIQRQCEAVTEVWHHICTHWTKFKLTKELKILKKICFHLNT